MGAACSSNAAVDVHDSRATLPEPAAKSASAFPASPSKANVTLEVSRDADPTARAAPADKAVADTGADQEPSPAVRSHGTSSSQKSSRSMLGATLKRPLAMISQMLLEESKRGASGSSSSMGASQLVRLLYTSVATTPFDDEALKTLVTKASKNNSHLNITGVLVYVDGIFIQVLEGSRGVVRKLYDKITRDPRHGTCTVVGVNAIRTRDYSSWGMTSASLDGSTEINKVLVAMLTSIQSSLSVVDRYTSTALAQLIREGVDPLSVKPDHGEAVIVVCGIAGVWKRRANLNPEDIVRTMSRFYKIVGDACAMSKGEIVKFVGEHVILLFETKNIEGAFQCAKTVVEVGKEKLGRRDSVDVTNVRAAIATGDVVRGNIGSEHTAFDYTLLGNAVNTASRMCSLKMDNQFCVVLTETSRKAIRRSGCRDRLVDLPNVHLKGKLSDEALHTWHPSIDGSDDEDAGTLTAISSVGRGTAMAKGASSSNTPENGADEFSELFRDVGDSMPLIQLVYVSRTAEDLTDDEVKEIADKAAINNEGMGVTGALLHLGDVFLQILEGDPDIVWELVEKIGKDSRHRDLTTVSVVGIDRRRFIGWGMRGFAVSDAADFVTTIAKRMLDTLSTAFRTVERYTPPKVLNLLISAQDPRKVRPATRNIITMVVDIVAFTSIAEAVSPSALIELVNTALGVVIESVRDKGGFTGRLVGDCVVAHFPVSAGEEAVQAAVEIQSKLRRIRRGGGNDGADGADSSLLHCGIGLALGPVVEANFGHAKLDFTTIGESVEDAHHAESSTRMADYNVLIHKSLNEVLDDVTEFTFVRDANVAGMYGIKDVPITEWNHDTTKKEILAKLANLPLRH